MNLNNKLKSNNSPYLESFIKTLARHPYICAFIVCVGTTPFYFGSLENITHTAVMLEFLSLLIAGAFILYKRYISDSITKFSAICSFAIWACADLMGIHFYQQAQNKLKWHFIGGILLVLLFYAKYYCKDFKRQLNSFLIIGASSVLKFCYVMATSVYTRQNDIGDFNGDIGHAGYISYLLTNHSLLNSDVRDRWQFYHPPLHHAISAVWIYICDNFFHTGIDPARESLQSLTLFYSITIIITAYRILRHFKLEGMSLYIPLVIISFHPAFILLSGSVNNDVLSVALMMGAVICTLKWYENKTLKNILKIALCVGLGMMTKLSAALVAIPIAFIFLIVFIKNFKASGKKLFGQYAAFGIVCVPLALWYQIRNYINWNVPITYVQEMGKDSTQYLGDRSFISRITDFSFYQFQHCFEQWDWFDDNGQLLTYKEFNPLIAAFKNSLFGESIYEANFAHGYMLSICKIFFWLGIIIAAAAFIAMVIVLIRKKSMPFIGKSFFGAFYLVIMVNYYNMQKNYPFICTMNFRYITPTVIIGCLFTGVLLKNLKSENHKAAKAVTVTLSTAAVLFAGLSSWIYLSLS